MTTRQHMRQIVEAAGLNSGTDLEDRVAYRLHRAGLKFTQQHRIGRYRLDFAWPLQRVAIEADGWHHRSPEGAAKDAHRDAWLRSEGWLILRVDDAHGTDSLELQIATMARLIHLIIADPGWATGPSNRSLNTVTARKKGSDR